MVLDCYFLKLEIDKFTLFNKVIILSLKYGSVCFNNSIMSCIQDNDLELENIGENYTVPDAFTFHVKGKI